MTIKTLFIGSGTFAVEILKGLQGFVLVELVGVVTQPDKPTGRKKIMTPSPVGTYVQGMESIFKPVKLRFDADKILQQTLPELVVVADYGQIVPLSIINYPKYKCLNVHGSLLPDLRGAVPIPVAILKGYKRTGVSIPIMTSKMDDGDVLAVAKVAIASNDTAESLKHKLAVIGSDLLNKTIPDWVAGKVKPVEQDESKATFTWQKDIAKEKAQIKPGMTVEEVDRMIRAFYTWPVAWCNINDGDRNKIVKIYSAEITESPVPAKQFYGFVKSGKKLILQLGDSGLIVNSIQMEGKRIMLGKDALFLDGKLLS